MRKTAVARQLPMALDPGARRAALREPAEFVSYGTGSTRFPASAQSDDERPIRPETRTTLIAAIARGRRGLAKLVLSQDATPEIFAHREGCSPRKVTMTISLAFLSPALIKAALEGQLPRRIGVNRLCDMPAEWSRQHQALGLNL